MSLNGLFEISLVIDDNNSIIFELDVSQTNENNLLKLSNEIAEKYKLPVKTKSILYRNLIKEIKKFRNNEIRPSPQHNSINQRIINRLYYQSTQVQKEREELFAKQRSFKKNEELIPCSFVPNINKKSHLLISKRSINEPIGDKLYNQRKKRGFYLYQGSTLDIVNKYLNHNGVIVDEHSREEDNKTTNELDVNIVQQNRKNEEEKIESKKVLQNNNENTKVNNHYNVYSLNSNSIQRNPKVIGSNFNLKKNKNTDNPEKQRNHLNQFTNISVQQKIFSPLEISNPIKKIDNKMIEPFSLSFNKEEKNFNQKLYKHSRKKRISTPTNNNEWHNHLYLSYRDIETRRLNEQKNFFKENYPFKPDISKESNKLMKYRNESPNQFYTRLTYTKTPSKNFINKSNHSSSPKVRELSVTKSTITNKILRSSPIYLKKNKIKDVKAEEKLYKNIQQMQTDKRKGIKAYQQNAISNIERYKLNQIKEMYNLLFKDGSTKTNFDNLYKENVPNHIIEKVVKPTCYVINDRNLEFNFQNFYVIARELLNKFFI